MRFLVDAALPPRLADSLHEAVHDAVHVRDYDMQEASDDDVLERADTEDRVVITPDSDFPAILALRGAARPSVIVVRLSARRSRSILPLLLANLPAIELALAEGSVVVLEDARIRIRSMPI